MAGGAGDAVMATNQAGNTSGEAFVGPVSVFTTSTTAFRVGTTGGSAFFTVDSSTPNVGLTQLTDVDYRFLSLVPYNYLAAASNSAPVMRRWNLTHSQSAVNASTDRGNQVMTLGYNNNASGLPESTADASMADRWEAYYETGGQWWFERHVAQIGSRSGGHFFRPIAITAKFATIDRASDPTSIVIDLQGNINFNTAGTSGSGTNYFSVVGTQFVFQSNQSKITDAGGTALLQSDASGNITLASAGKTTTIKGPVKLLSTGAAPVCGSVTLVAGSAAVSTTAITASSIVLLTATASPLGRLYVTSVSAGSGFTIQSTNTTGSETPTVTWVLIEPF